MNFKEALIAHLQGETVEVCAGDTIPQPLIKALGITPISTALDLSEDFDKLYTFRLATRTIMCNGVEVPAPEKDAPKVGICVFVADPTSNTFHFSIRWAECEQYYEYLKRGLVYLNKEDAIARAKAMLIVKEG